MTIKPENPPAFPCKVEGAWLMEDGNPKNKYQLPPSRHPGMTLRDYFIAHAPTCPQLWFEPAMPDAPIEPESISSLTGKDYESYHRYEFGNIGRAELTPEAAKFASKIDDIRTQRAKWAEDFEKQRWIQWPKAWANAMLIERSKGDSNA